MSDPNKPRDVSPSWTWGSSARIDFDVSGPPGTVVAASAQLAQVSLTEPAVCSLYVQASFRSSSPFDTIDTFTLNLYEGVGRVTVPRQITFENQPSLGSPLEFTVPFVPVHALNVEVTTTLFHSSEDPGETAGLEIYFVLSPLTRIPQKVQQLAFGMATPGEADDLDDGLREELEAEGPTVQEIMSAGQTSTDASDGDAVEGDHEEDDDEEGDDEPQSPIDRLRAALSDRLGRPPTRLELKATIRRIKARQARRRGR